MWEQKSAIAEIEPLRIGSEIAVYMHRDSNEWEIRLKTELCLCLCQQDTEVNWAQSDFTRLTGTLLEEAFFSITAALQLWICLCVCVFPDSS